VYEPVSELVRYNWRKVEEGSFKSCGTWLGRIKNRMSGDDVVPDGDL